MTCHIDRILIYAYLNIMLTHTKKFLALKRILHFNFERAKPLVSLIKGVMLLAVFALAPLPAISGALSPDIVARYCRFIT